MCITNKGDALSFKPGQGNPEKSGASVCKTGRKYRQKFLGKYF